MTKKTQPKKSRAIKMPLTPEEYNTFLKSVEMRDVLLLESSVKRLAFPDSDAALGINVRSLKPRCKRYPDGFTVTAIYEIELTQQLEDAEPEAFGTFRVGFEIFYASAVPLTDALFEVFKQLNLPLNIWPYVRQHVHQQSVLLGLPPLVMPVHRSP